MHNVKIISLKEPFTDEFNGVLCVSCMSYIIALIFGQSRIYNHDCCQLQPSFVYYLNNTPHDYYRDRYELCVLHELEFYFLNTLDVDSK